jgi:hypothetical protein
LNYWYSRGNVSYFNYLVRATAAWTAPNQKGNALGSIISVEIWINIDAYLVQDNDFAGG